MNLTTASLRELVALSEKRDALRAELDAVDGKIRAAIGGKPRGATVDKVVALAKSEKKAKPRAKKAKRGPIKDAVLSALESMGEAGGNLADLAKRTGLDPNSLGVWLYTSGKKLAEIEKVGRGLFRHTATAAKAAPAKRAKKTAKKKTGKKQA